MTNSGTHQACHRSPKKTGLTLPTSLPKPFHLPAQNPTILIPWVTFTDVKTKRTQILFHPQCVWLQLCKGALPDREGRIHPRIATAGSAERSARWLPSYLEPTRLHYYAIGASLTSRASTLSFLRSPWTCGARLLQAKEELPHPER